MSAAGDLARRPPPARRLVAVLVGGLVGVGLLLTAGPVSAGPRGSSSTEEAGALRLLEEAARASRSLTYTGTAYVASWQPEGTTSSLVDVRHDPHHGMTLTTSPTAVRPGTDDESMVLAATSLDRALLRVLRDTYELRLAGPGRCTGREAEVVEARRSTDAGGTVAGRFWVDLETGLLLRREVYDETGRRVRSSAFVDLVLAEAPRPEASSRRTAAREPGEPVSRARLARLRDDGWHVPESLPGGYVLFASRSRSSDDLLHLAYSDGLSTTSLFVQRGDLGDSPPDGFARRHVADHQVWARNGAPGRMVWAGGGRVWTVVSNAPAGDLSAAVDALPHDPLPDTGLRGRLGRGLSRLSGWLNPFD